MGMHDTGRYRQGREDTWRAYENIRDERSHDRAERWDAPRRQRSGSDLRYGLNGGNGQETWADDSVAWQDEPSYEPSYGRGSGHGGSGYGGGYGPDYGGGEGSGYGSADQEWLRRAEQAREPLYAGQRRGGRHDAYFNELRSDLRYWSEGPEDNRRGDAARHDHGGAWRDDADRRDRGNRASDERGNERSRYAGSQDRMSGSGYGGSYGDSYGHGYGGDYRSDYRSDDRGDYRGDQGSAGYDRDDGADEYGTDEGTAYGRDYGSLLASEYGLDEGRRDDFRAAPHGRARAAWTDTGGDSWRDGGRSARRFEDDDRARDVGEEHGMLYNLGHRIGEALGEWFGPASDERTQRVGPRNYQRTDDRIRDEICEHLTFANGVDVRDVSVEVKGGIVTLDGTVRHRSQKYDIEDIADNTFGVTEVDNRIRVARPSTDTRSTTGTTGTTGIAD